MTCRRGLFLAVALLGALPAAAQDAKAPRDANVPQGEVAPQVKQTLRALWEDSASAPDDSQQPSAADSEFLRTLRSLQAMQTQPVRQGVAQSQGAQAQAGDSNQAKQPAEPSVPIERQPVAQAGHTPAKVAPQPPVATELPDASELLEAVRRIQGAVVDPNASAQLAQAAPLGKIDHQQLPAAARLADRLYRQGKYAPAAVLYEALAERSQEQGATAAWAMYQVGVCYQGIDVARSLAAFQRVEVEYPDSTWASMAQLQKRLIETRRQVQRSADLGSQPADGALSDRSGAW